MIPKGRLIIIGGNGKDTVYTDQEILSAETLFRETLCMVSEQKDIRIEIITASDCAEITKAKYGKVFSEEGYNNTGCIHIRKDEDLDEYYSRIFEAKAVVLDDQPEILDALKKSLVSKLLYKKYVNEEDFTIVGISTGAIGISTYILKETGGTEKGFGFLNNCIIDPTFNHQVRFRELVKAILSHHECLGLGLNSGTALIIEKGYRASCIGKGPIMVVNAKDVRKRRFRKGASIYCKNLKGQILTHGSTLNLFSGELIKDQLFDYNLNFTNRNTIQ